MEIPRNSDRTDLLRVRDSFRVSICCKSQPTADGVSIFSPTLAGDCRRTTSRPDPGRVEHGLYIGPHLARLMGRILTTDELGEIAAFARENPDMAYLLRRNTPDPRVLLELIREKIKKEAQ